MRSMEKLTKTYRYEKEIITHAETNPAIHSFAEWACDRYRKEFLDIESKIKQLEDITVQADRLKAEIKQIKASDKNMLLSDAETRWIQNEAVSRIQRATFEGVYRYFTREFGREDINRRQFQILVDKYGVKK